MKKSDYLRKAFELYNKEIIDAETYDSIISNNENFCDDDEEEK